MKKLLFTMMVMSVFSLFSLSLMAQGKTVTGKVTDVTSGQPVSFASIHVKGTTVGVEADAEGQYSLNAPSDAILVVTYIGYNTVEVAVDGRNIVNIQMQESAIRLDELVVTAMGISREKKTLGYASQEVKSDELAKAKQTDLNNALVGKVSGVRFYGGSGSKFDEGSIMLRGTSSLSANGSSPIYVVDGVITSVSSVNMDDVASLNVLKGPAATAVYGSRGGNGAIVITTKSAEKDKTVVTFSETFTVETPKIHGRYQNNYGGGNLGGDASLPGAQQLKTYSWSEKDAAYMKQLDGARYYDMNIDESWGPQLDGTPYAAFFTWDPTHPRFGELSTWSPQPDNLKNLYRTGWSSTTNLAFAKSTDKMSTRVSFSNVSREGILPGSDANRKFLSVKTAFNVSKRMKISLDYRLAYRMNHNAAVEGYSGSNAAYTFTQWGNRHINTNDLKDYKRSEGSYYTWNVKGISNMETSYMENPFALYHEQQRVSKGLHNNFNATVSYDITKKIQISGSMLGNLRSDTYNYLLPQGFRSLSEYYVTQTQVMDTQIQGRVKYGDRWWKNRIVFDANLFIEQRDYSREYAYAFTRDGLNLPGFSNVAASTGLPGGENTQRKQKDRSIFGIATISLDDTYFLEASIRNDWTSTLPKGGNSYLYGGVSASVLLNKYIKGAKWLDFWKIRASVAQVGSTMDPYNVYETYIMSDKYGGLTSMRFDANLKDPNILPTISSSFEAGMEARMFKGRLYFDLNFYMKNSKNQIINMSTTGASGYTSRKINAGMIQNKGIEITLGGDIISTKNFNWNLTANFSRNINTLKELVDGTNELQLGSWGTGSTAYMMAVVGEPVGVIRSSTWKYDPESGLPILIKRAASSANATRGDYDIAYDSTPNEIGNAQPFATGGFTTGLTWKSLSVGATIDYQIGGNMISITNLYGEGAGQLEATAGNNANGKPIRSPLTEGGGVEVTGVVMNANGQYEKVTTMMGARTYFKRRNSGWNNYIYDASYVKLRELSVTYDINSDFLKRLKVGLSKASISFVASNPWLIYSAIPNIDPSEHSGNRNGSSTYEYMNVIETGQAFSSRTFGFSLNLTF